MLIKYRIFFYLVFKIYILEAGSIQGNIIDAVNQLPLVGANISVIANNVGAVSDDDGNFSITGLENGYYSISVKYMGYESKSIADIWVRDKAYEFLNIQLKPTILDYSGVTVTDERRVQVKKFLGFSMLCPVLRALVKIDKTCSLGVVVPQRTGLLLTTFIFQVFHTLIPQMDVPMAQSD